MPRKRPQREPLTAVDGSLSRRWAEYFDGVADDSANSPTFETETQFVSASSNHVDPIRSRHRLNAVESDLRELKFREH